MPPSHMDTAVTRLLVATRQLLESLTMWANGRLTDQEVSDIYVKLGNDFNTAVIAFNEYKISMDDLLCVPDDLRTCLESCLGLEPSQENLEIYLPEIRQIIVVLLQGLKDKQTVFKRRMAGRGGSGAVVGGTGTGGTAGQGHGQVQGQGHLPVQDGNSRRGSTSSAGGIPQGHVNSGGAGYGAPVPGQGQGQIPQPSQARSSSGSIPSSNGGGGGGGAGERSRSPLSHFHAALPPNPSQAHSSQQQQQQQQHPLPPLPSSSDAASTRTMSSYNSVGNGTPPQSQYFEAGTSSFSQQQQNQSNSNSRGALPARSNLRAGQPLPPPPPDAFRPPRSRPSEVGGVSPALSNSSGTFAPGGSAGGGGGRLSPSSRSSGRRSPSPLPQQLYNDDPIRSTSPHKVTLTDNGPLPPTSAFQTPPKASTTSFPSNAPTFPGPGPMTPPPRGQRRPPEPPSTIDTLASAYRTPPANAHLHSQQQSRFSLDSEVDTPKSMGTTRDSLAVSDMSFSNGSHGHGHGHGNGSGVEVGGQKRGSEGLPTIVLPPEGLPPPPGDAPPLPATSEGSIAPPSQDNPAALASLTALQNSEALGRRASKRYSSYHMKQMLPSHSKGPSSSSLRYNNGEIPAMPTTLPSPARPQRRVSGAVPPMPTVPGSPATSVMNTPEKGAGTSRAVTEEPIQEIATTQARSPDPVQQMTAESSTTAATNSGAVTPAPYNDDSDIQPTRSVSSISGMSVFLQYGRETKKVLLDSQQLSSVADLQGVFMSRFDYSPEGMDLFPDVYIKDPTTGIAYHLEEMEDIKSGALLSLNIDPLDQVKQHFDNTITSLSLEIKDLKNNMARSRRLSVLQQDAVHSPQPKSVERMAASPMVRAVTSGSLPTVPNSMALGLVSPIPSVGGMTAKSDADVKVELQSQFQEIQSLRRDLGAMRQIYIDFVSSSKESFQTIREQTLAVREVALSKLKGSRPLVNAGKAALEKQSSDTVEAVDEISDNIDTVKDDVVRRQILPRPGQLAGMRQELDKAQKQVADLKQQVTLLMPTCKQTWNQELKNVVDEQKLLQHQQKLAADLEGDISQAAEVFDTLEQYVAQRQLGMGAGKQLRSYQRPASQDEQAAVPNLLMEIRTKEADPNKRLRAIEQQQRAREREKADQGDDFSNELTGFVSSRKLKKTGGTEEAERIRLKRQDKSFKKMYEGIKGGGGETGGEGSGVRDSTGFSGPMTPQTPQTPQTPDVVDGRAVGGDKGTAVISETSEKANNDKVEERTSPKTSA